MSEITDIRAWARANGITIGDRGRPPKHVVEAYEAAQAEDGPVHVPVPDLEESPPFASGPVNGSPGSPGSQPSSSTTTPGETPPKPRRRGFRDRIKDQADKLTGDDKHRGRRISLERWADRAWRIGARFLGAPDTPTGRLMTIQAPVAGVVLDDVVKNTALDKLAQPVARFTESSAEVWGLVGPPVLVYAIERVGPVPVLVESLRDALKEWVVVAGPAMRKQKERERKALEAAQQFRGEDGEPVESVDALIDALLAEIFGIVPGEVVQEEPAAA